MITIHVIPASTTGQDPSLHRIIQTTEPPTLEQLAHWLGGPPKIIEGFDTVLRQGELEECIALRNEWNAGAVNTWANLLWLQALVREHGFAESKPPTTLRGPVVLLWGNFQKALAHFDGKA